MKFLHARSSRFGLERMLISAGFCAARSSVQCLHCRKHSVWNNTSESLRSRQSSSCAQGRTRAGEPCAPPDTGVLWNTGWGSGLLLSINVAAVTFNLLAFPVFLQQTQEVKDKLKQRKMGVTGVLYTGCNEWNANCEPGHVQNNRRALENLTELEGAMGEGVTSRRTS